MFIRTLIDQDINDPLRYLVTKQVKTCTKNSVDHIKMYLQNFKLVVVIFSVICVSIKSTSAVQIPSIAMAQAQRVSLGNLTRNIEVSGFKKTYLTTRTWDWCGGYYVYMQICGLENHMDDR